MRTLYLFLQFLTVTILSWIFILILEILGHLTYKLYNKITNKITNNITNKVDQNDELKLNNDQNNELNDDFITNVFIGSIVWTMIIFGFGILGVSNQIVIMAFSSILLVISLIKNYRIYIKKNSKKKLTIDFVLYSSLIPVYLALAYFAFKPITSFDGLWYHIPIPRTFLQNGNIDYLGYHTRYSVHPYMNFFWNMFFLSIPQISLVLKGIVINFFLTNLIFLGVLKLSLTLKNELESSKFVNYFTPLLLSGILIVTDMLSWGYNDLYAYAFGLMIVSSLLVIAHRNIFTKLELFTLALLCAGLFMLKIFFAVSGFFIVLFIIYKYLTINKFNKDNLSYLIKTALVLLAIFVLPWLIRSYYWTGRILDPIGAYGVTEDVYNFVGSNTAQIHWGKFIENRLSLQFFHIHFLIFSPLFLLGTLSLFNQNIKKYREIAFLGVTVFWISYLLNIAGEMRYQLAIVPFVLVSGILLVDNIYKASKFIGGTLVIILALLVPVLTYRNYFTTLYKRDDSFLGRSMTINDYMRMKTGDYNINYYRNIDSLVPIDLTNEENIFVYHISNAYIKNPTIELSASPKLENKKDAQEFFQALKNLKVKYILMRSNQTPAKPCKQSMVKELETCDDLKYYQEVTEDKNNGVKWWKIL